MSERRAAVCRQTTETSVEVEFDLDGGGAADVTTGVGALDHFLTLFARHGVFDLRVRATGDLQIDAHHTVEDVGIVLGQAIREALGDHRGIQRVGAASVPMDEALATVVVDCGGRSHYVQRGSFSGSAVGSLDTRMVAHFFDSLTRESRITMHVTALYGADPHHEIEAVFKAFGRALDSATRINPRITGRLPSTKERIEGSG